LACTMAAADPSDAVFEEPHTGSGTVRTGPESVALAFVANGLAAAAALRPTCSASVAVLARVARIASPKTKRGVVVAFAGAVLWIALTSETAWELAPSGALNVTRGAGIAKATDAFTCSEATRTVATTGCICASSGALRRAVRLAESGVACANPLTPAHPLAGADGVSGALAVARRPKVSGIAKASP